jgi:hypothetical protein
MLVRKLLVVGLTLLVCLLILEFGLRIIGRTPTNMSDGIYEQDGDSFRLKKNATKVIKYPAFTYTVYTNEFGFRAASAGRSGLGHKPFYAVLGASEVFGNGVQYEDTFIGIFATEAQRKGMEVMNLATGGHNFLDQEALLKSFIADSGHKPSTVMLCLNALHIPAFDQKNKHIIVKSGHAIDRDGWRITYLRLMAGNISSAFCFFRDGIRKIQEKWLEQSLGSKSSQFLDVYSKANPIRRPERIKAFEDYLASFEAYCRQNGMTLVYVYLPLSDSFRLTDLVRLIGENPDDYDASFYGTLMHSYCQKAGVKLVDLGPVLQEKSDEGQDLRFKLDPHFNVFGNRVIGEYLIKALLED